MKPASKLLSQNWLMEIGALLCRDECLQGVDGGQVGHVEQGHVCGLDDCFVG